jgi:hypothetical protein
MLFGCNDCLSEQSYEPQNSVNIKHSCYVLQKVVHVIFAIP